MPAANGLSLERPVAVSLIASDPSGVARIEFLVDGMLLATDSSSPYQAEWDIAAFSNGAHTLTIVGYDTLENTTTLSFDVDIALLPPPAPVIDTPTNNLTTSLLQIEVGGTADASVQIYLNGSPIGETISTVEGRFSGLVALELGLNELQATASNRAGESSLSNLVQVFREEVTVLPYRCEISAITPVSSRGDVPIVISGDAIDNDGAVSGVDLRLVVTNAGGGERQFEVTTDASGQFDFSYQAAPDEAGEYSVACIHPDSTERAVQGTFSIGRVFVDPTTLELNIPRNSNQALNFTATTSDGYSATNLRLEYLGIDQPTGDFEPGISITPSAPVSLGPAQSAQLSVSVVADDNAFQTGIFYLRLVSDESLLPLALIRVSYFFADAEPSLTWLPSFLEVGVAIGATQTAQVILENRGFEDALDTTIQLISGNGEAVPSWVALTSMANQGTIAVGEERFLGLMARPGEGVSEGIYEFLIRVDGSNYNPVDIPVFVSVTQAGSGSVLFKLTDIYTETLNNSGQLIEGLAGGEIRLQNEQVLTVDETLITDELGNALFSDLPPGNYKFRASADKHQSLVGRLKIQPGVTVTEEVFLDYSLVSIEWSVTEIALEDRYTIDLDATFETDVPAPVVVIEPASTALSPDMLPGEIIEGEWTITNHGLVRADNFRLIVPETDEFFQYEFFGDVPDTLAPKQQITVPYKITALQSLRGNTLVTARSNISSAKVPINNGGCTSYSQCGGTNHDYVCANSARRDGSSTSCFTSGLGNSCDVYFYHPTTHLFPNGPDFSAIGDDSCECKPSDDLSNECLECKDGKIKPIESESNPTVTDISTSGRTYAGDRSFIDDILSDTFTSLGYIYAVKEESDFKVSAICAGDSNWHAKLDSITIQHETVIKRTSGTGLPRIEPLNPPPDGNYCISQVVDMATQAKLTDFNPPRSTDFFVYPTSAIEAHELVHANTYEEALRDSALDIEKEIEGIFTVSANEISRSEATSILQEQVNLFKSIYFEIWRKEIDNNPINDHGEDGYSGPTKDAEKTVVRPLLIETCDNARIRQGVSAAWDTCIDVCNRVGF